MKTAQQRFEIQVKRLAEIQKRNLDKMPESTRITTYLKEVMKHGNQQTKP